MMWEKKQLEVRTLHLVIEKRILLKHQIIQKSMIENSLVKWTPRHPLNASFREMISQPRLLMTMSWSREKVRMSFDNLTVSHVELDLSQTHR